jgi:hypothetical protein
MQMHPNSSHQRILAVFLFVAVCAGCAPNAQQAPTEEVPTISISEPNTPTPTVSIPYEMILTSPTVLRASVEMSDDGYFVLSVNADRVLPQPEELSDGGRIDFIWFVDVDTNRETGQFASGNDFNIHVVITESGWSTEIFPVSSAAIASEEERRAFEDIEVEIFEISFKLSVPESVFFNDPNFRWWLEASGKNASPEWQETLSFPFVTDEFEFGP